MIKEELMNKIAYRQKLEIDEADELVNEGLNEAIDAVLEFWEENKVTVSKEEKKWLDKLTDIYDLKTATYYITRCGYGHGFEFTFQDKTYRLEDNDEQNYLEISEMKERFLKALFYGYEVEKEKLYRARHKLTGEYLSQNYTKTGYYHGLDHFHILKLSKKDWEELGVLGDKVYEIEEVEE